MERIAIASIREWARARGPVDDLEGHAAALKELLTTPDAVARSRPGGAPDGHGAAAPWLGVVDPLEQLGDAVCLLLQRYLGPAREGEPALLAELLRLAFRLRLAGARATVVGLLVTGGFRGIEGPDGPLERQMLELLAALGLDDDERAALRQVIEALDAGTIDASGDARAEPPAEELPAIAPADERGDLLPGDQVPQVNDPDQVFALVDALRDGVTDRRSYAAHARVSVRQADFVARAAASLGLVALERGGGFALTELGEGLPLAEDPAGRERRHRIVGHHPLMRALHLEPDSEPPDLDAVTALLSECTALGAGTIRRRAQALRRWVAWWQEGGR